MTMMIQKSENVTAEDVHEIAKSHNRGRFEIEETETAYIITFEKPPAPSHERKAEKKRLRAQQEADTYDGWTEAEIFERDEGICQLCGYPVSTDPNAPDALRPQYDHLMPLAAGSTNTRNNVILAHAYCNLSKGQRVFCTEEEAAEFVAQCKKTILRYLIDSQKPPCV